MRKTEGRKKREREREIEIEIERERERENVSYRKPVTVAHSVLWLFIEVVWSAAVGRRPSYRSSEIQARTATQ